MKHSPVSGFKNDPFSHSEHLLSDSHLRHETPQVRSSVEFEDELVSLPDDFSPMVDWMTRQTNIKLVIIIYLEMVNGIRSVVERF
jgi:hypothetical protein